jgi:hypothetical protein
VDEVERMRGGREKEVRVSEEVGVGVRFLLILVVSECYGGFRSWGRCEGKEKKKARRQLSHYVGKKPCQVTPVRSSSFVALLPFPSAN